MNLGNEKSVFKPVESVTPFASVPAIPAAYTGVARVGTDLYVGDGVRTTLTTPRKKGGRLTLQAVGDSIAANSVDGNQIGLGELGQCPTQSFAAWCCAKSKGSLIQISGGYITTANSGTANGSSVPSYTTADIDAIWANKVASKQADFVVLEIGFNNIYGASDATIATVITDLKAWYQSRILDIKAWGGVPVLCTQTPAPTTWSGYSVTKRKYGIQLNQWFRNEARNLGCLLFDLENVVVDPANTNGEVLAAYGADKVHPNTLYRRLIGEALWAVIKDNVQQQDIQIKARYAPNLLFNDPLLYTTGGTVTGLAGGSVLPTLFQPWNAAAETTAAQVACSDGIGNWCQLTQVWSGGATVSVATGFNFYTAPGVAANLATLLTGFNIVAGDKIRFSLEIDVVTSTSLAGVQALLQLGTTTSVNYILGAITPFNGNYVTADTNASNGVFVSDVFTVPTGLTFNTAYLWIQPGYTGNGTNVWRFRRLMIEKV